MKFKGRAATVISAAALAVIGCSEGPKPTPSPTKTVEKDGRDGHSHAAGEHAHGEHGPHGGDIVELGKEEYHAEIVHDEATGKVTIYVLDSEAKKPVSIEAGHVTINVRHDGKGEQFEVKAAPQAGDADGKSSRFVSEDKELAADLEHDARLVLEIQGKSYTGEIRHKHDHAQGDSHKPKP